MHLDDDVQGAFAQDGEVCCNPWLVRVTRSSARYASRVAAALPLPGAR